MSEKQIYFFIYLSQFSIFIPFIVGLYRINTRPRYLQVLFTLVILSGLTDFLYLIIKPEYMPFIRNLYIILQYLAILNIYQRIFQKGFIKTSIDYLYFIFIIYAIINMIWIEGVTIRNDNLRTISSFTFILLSITFMYQQINSPSVPDMLRYPMFWLNTAMLIYFSGNLFTNIAISIYSFKNIYQFYYPIHNMLNVLKNLLFAVSFSISVGLIFKKKYA